jgi:hypothetical protein
MKPFLKPVVCFFIALASPLWAQELPVSKVLPVRYTDVESASVILRTLVPNVTPSRTLKVVAVRGSKESVAAAEEALKLLDVPPVNIELTVYLVNATRQGGKGAPIPVSLEALVKQLRAEFPYPEYRLLDSLIIRARDGADAEASGVMGPSGPGSSEVSKAFYQLRVRSVSVAGEGNARTIRIDGLRCGLRVPYGPPDKVSYADIGANTSLDLHEGQKVVAGKSSIDGTADTTFMILSAKVVD